jgi:uncharacterized membrane protein YqjE
MERAVADTAVPEHDRELIGSVARMLREHSTEVHDRSPASASPSSNSTRPNRGLVFGFWQKTCSATHVRLPAVQSRPVYERPGYRTLLGRIRENVRTYIRKQLELPRQEIAEIVRANVAAAKWFGVALAFVFMSLTALVVLIVALIALLLPLWASALVVLVLMGLGAAITGFVGYKRLDLRGPTRSINSVKETIRWAKQRLLGRSAS